MGALCGKEKAAAQACVRKCACNESCGYAVAERNDGDRRWNSEDTDRCSSSEEEGIRRSIADKDVRVRDVRSEDFSELKLSKTTGLHTGSCELGHRFEALTNLCSTVCKVPMCCITDLHSSQPWIPWPAVDGMTPKQSQSTADNQTPFRDTPFCTWTLQQPPMVPLLVEDTLLDERFSSSPHVVCAPHIRFYAGVPLVSPDGTLLGVLSIMDTKPATEAAQSAESRLSLLTNFANMAVRELKRERLLSVQQVAGDALLAERAKLMQLMDLGGHGTAVMLLEVPSAADGPSLQSASVDYSSGSLHARTSSSCRIGMFKSHWRVICVNEAWEASTGHVNARVANHSFWSLARAQGDEAEADNVRKACLSAVAAQLNFSATLQMSSGADAAGDCIMTLRLLFHCADKSRVQEPNNSPKSSSTNLSMLFSVPASSSCFYFVSIASASNPIVPAPREAHSSGLGLGLGLTLLQESSAIRKGATPRSSSKLVKLEDRSMRLLDEEMNVTKDLKVEALLGHGSFGRVYKGLYGDQPVAVKVLQCTLDQAGGHELEALLPAHIEHPNVLRTYKHCTRPLKDAREHLPPSCCRMVETWMVMEYANHGSLSDAVMAGRFHGCMGHGHLTSGPLPDDADLVLVLDTARDVASAMCHLHSLDILHGDLTGSNILLCSAPEEEYNRSVVAKVADFGLSRILASDRIRTKTYGAVSHTPPELLLNGSLSKAVDVYAFGVIFWEMMAGKRPYRGLTHPQIISHISNGRSLDIRSDWPSGIRKLMAGCLSTQAAERPSFVQVLSQLETLQDKLC